MKPDRPLPVVFYKTEAGNEPVREWLVSLTKREKKIIGGDIKTVQFGWPLGMPLVEKLEAGLWEVRTKLENKISRTIFTMTDEHIVLLHGFVKKTQKIVKQDLDTARSRMKEVKGGK
ncbi:MAG: type II toxin-antitoxin system RelE/ParE family toxin [Candidatus Omnitrophica bacterium]|nr:type II toxin-antitoxin system RelE/ParE family toxin [Candidatus Omnitrophota bacterium]